jgi:hypothetical protein
MSLQQASRSNAMKAFALSSSFDLYVFRTPMLACLLACLLAALGFSEVHEISKKAASSWGL